MYSKRIIPTPGVRVVDPVDMSALPPDGKVVAGNESYWIRQMLAGDCREAAAPSIQDAGNAAEKKGSK